MSNNPENLATNLVQLRPQSVQFWVSSSPFFSTTLLFEPLDEPAHVRLFDADGNQFNELLVNFQPGTPGLLDLEPCMAACKFESGIKHARVEIALTKPQTIFSRMHTRDWAGITREALPVSALRKFMVPFFCQSERTSLVALLNRLDQDIEVRARLFVANRSPEVIWKIPPLGCRFFDTKLEFADVLEQTKELTQGYVRLSVVGDDEIYVQAFEAAGSAKQPRYFSFFT